MLVVVNDHNPIQDWLFWRYASYWAVSLGWLLCCLATGHRVLLRLKGWPVSLSEHFVLATGVGVYVFFVGMFVGGLLGLYGWLFALAWPAAMLALGAPALWRTSRRVRRLFGRFVVGPVARPGALGYLVALFGLLGIGALYFLILSPTNVAFDARWYHLRIAEHYAASRAVRPFAEGWFPATQPHLASFIYTWAFLLPGTILFDRVELCAHLEFVIFLWTLAGIPVLVRRMVGLRVPLAWAALFLFPGILLYNSTLVVAADHIAASWAVPIYLALLLVWKNFEARNGLLLVLLLSAAMLTKYQCMYLVVVPVAAFLVRAGWAGRQALAAGRKRCVRWLVTVTAAGLGGLVFCAPHWLKNWVWYGDPLYPFLNRVLGGHPWNPDAAWLEHHVFLNTWKPMGSLAQRILETTGALATFSFVPHDWLELHGTVPVFGFLFTLLLPVLLFFPRRARLWGLALAANVGVFLWYWTFHQDRYLQILLPWMATVACSVIVLVWHTHRFARLPLACLIGLQIIWGGDVYFVPTHKMARSPILATSNLIAGGFSKDRGARLRCFYPYEEVGQTLPSNARLLLHEVRGATGVRVTAVSDAMGWQGAISYGRLATPSEIYEKLRGLGITHILWTPAMSMGYDMLAGDLKFLWFVERHAGPVARYGQFALGALGARPASDARFPEVVAYLGCGATYARGLYRLDELTTLSGPEPESQEPVNQFYPPPHEPIPSEALPPACGFVVREKSCRLPNPDLKGYRLLAERGDLELLTRN